MIAFIALLLLLASPALAQEPPKVDPRLAGLMLNAANAEMVLRDAALRAMQEDMKKREAEWAEYSKPLWQPSNDK